MCLRILKARTLSRAVMRNIRRSLVFAFIYSVGGVPIVAGVLYPVFGLLPSPAIAAAAMALSSVSVIGNALRLTAVRLQDRRAGLSHEGCPRERRIVSGGLLPITPSARGRACIRLTSGR